MIVQTLVITAIIYFIYKIINLKYENNKIRYFIPIICFILYSIIDMSYLRHGIYWASASVLYIWPLLPFFAFIFLYMKICYKIKEQKKVKYIIFMPLIIILNFFATFSQEQIGIAIIAFEISFVILHHRKSLKKYLFFDLVNIVVSIISYFALFFAPGNWVRMDSNEYFSSLSIFDKVKCNLPKIIDGIFNSKMAIYIYILAFLLIYMAIVLIKNNYRNQKKYIFFLVPLIISLIEITVMMVSNKYYNKYIFCLCGLLWLMSFFVVSLFYFYREKNIEFCALHVSAFCCVFCLLMSPSIIERTFLPFIFFLFIIIIRICIDILIDKSYILKIITLIIIFLIGYKGTKMYIRNYIGYRDNYTILKLNDMILKNYDKEDGKNVELYKVQNIWYSSEQPYNIPSIEYWMKEYYNIPSNVIFNWVDIYKNIRQ